MSEGERVETGGVEGGVKKGSGPGEAGTKGGEGDKG